MSIVEELRVKTSRDNRDLLDRAANEIEWLRQDLEGAYERIDELIHKYDLAVAEREANVKGFTEELTKARDEIEQLKRNLEQCENGYRQQIHLLQCKLTDARSEVIAEIEEEIDRGLSVISKILNSKGDRANGKTVLLSKYDVFIEAKKHIVKLKKKYTGETQNEN